MPGPRRSWEYSLRYHGPQHAIHPFAQYPSRILSFGLAAAESPQTPVAIPKRAAFVEGKDYLVLERRRFLDETRFDRPVEAFSMLFPRGWNIQGGVKWRGIQECRGDIVSNQVKATSPDGAIQYEAMPSRTFTWTDDQMMLQVMQAGAQRGGCAINQPFDAAR